MRLNPDGHGLCGCEADFGSRQTVTAPIIINNHLFFSRMRAWHLLGRGAKDHLSAKKTILDIKKSKRVLDNAFLGE